MKYAKYQLFVFVSSFLVACSSAQVVGDGVSQRESATDLPVEDGCHQADSLEAEIVGAELRDQTLLLEVAAAGDCQEEAEVRYRVCPSDEILSSDPPQWDMWLVIDSATETCQPEISQTLRLDLSELHLRVDKLLGLDGRRFRVELERY